MKNRRVVITGVGALTPIGNNLQEYWENLIKGVSGAAPITRFNAKEFKTQFACEVKNFNPTHVLDRKESRKLKLIVCHLKLVEKQYKHLLLYILYYY